MQIRYTHTHHTHVRKRNHTISRCCLFNFQSGNMRNLPIVFCVCWQFCTTAKDANDTLCLCCILRAHIVCDNCRCAISCQKGIETPISHTCDVNGIECTNSFPSRTLYTHCTVQHCTIALWQESNHSVGSVDKPVIIALLPDILSKFSRYVDG